MPAVTTRFVSTKALIRKGRKTGCPVSGCSDESTTFFACHSSGVMSFMSPFLYDVSRFFAPSRPVAETKRVLYHGID